MNNFLFANELATDIMPLFEKIEERSLSSAVLHAAMTHLRRGDCTREQMLIALVIWYDEEREKRFNEDVEKLRNRIVR